MVRIPKTPTRPHNPAKPGQGAGTRVADTPASNPPAVIDAHLRNELPRGVVHKNLKPKKLSGGLPQFSVPVNAVLLGAVGVTSLVNAQPAMAATSFEMTDADLNGIDIGLNLDPNAARRVHVRSAVGPNATNNESDVRAIQERLNELGFEVSVDGKFGPQTLRAMKTFEAMIGGNERLTEVSGLIRPGSELHKILESSKAPRWVEMPRGGVGWVNGDRDDHDYGSDHLVRVVEEAGRRYYDDYLSQNPGAAKIATNDVSVKRGGDTPDHYTHENGLDLDLRLPRKDGTHGSRTNWANYDREATFAMVKAFASDPNVERLILTDYVILDRIADGGYDWGHKVFDGGDGHKNHIHIDITPPTFDGIEIHRSAELLNRRLGRATIL